MVSKHAAEQNPKVLPITLSTGSPSNLIEVYGTSTGGSTLESSQGAIKPVTKSSTEGLEVQGTIHKAVLYFFCQEACHEQQC